VRPATCAATVRQGHCRQVWIAQLAAVEGHGGGGATVGHWRVAEGEESSLKLFFCAALLYQIFDPLDAGFREAVALRIADRGQLMDDLLGGAELLELFLELWPAV
jgi:hypothetical protein